MRQALGGDCLFYLILFCLSGQHKMSINILMIMIMIAKSLVFQKTHHIHSSIQSVIREQLSAGCQSF